MAMFEPAGVKKSPKKCEMCQEFMFSKYLYCFKEPGIMK